MQCACDGLSTFSRNDPRLGATPGAVRVLHPHTRRLDLHPPVHLGILAAAPDTPRMACASEFLEPTSRSI